MSNKLYIQNRLYNVNDRIAALDLYERIMGWIDEGLLKDMAEPFLPFKSSNNTGVDGEDGIFEMDRKELEECNGVVGYLDGWTYDPGCGFEIGCGYAWGYPIHLISTNIFTSSVGDSKEYYQASRLVEHISDFAAVSDLNQEIGDYRARNIDVLERAIGQFKENLIRDFGEPGRIATPVAPLPVEYDYYLDPNFRYTEYGRVMLETIKEAAKAAGKTYVVGDNQGDIDEDLNHLRKSGQAILLFDTAEPNIDSSVLQGIAYGLGRKPIVYASSQQRVLMSGRFVIQLNTMNYYSAAAVVHSMEELLGMISE